MRRVFALLGWSWVTIVVVAVGLVSGIGSILRGWLVLFRPGWRDVSAVFAVCVNTCLVVAAISAGVVQSQRILALQEYLDEGRTTERPKVILEYRALEDPYKVSEWERTDLYLLNTSDTDAYDVWFEPVQIGDFFVRPRNPLPRLAMANPLPIEYIVMYPNGSANFQWGASKAPRSIRQWPCRRGLPRNTIPA